MRLAVDHLCVHAVNGCKVVDELAFGLGHGGKNLYPLVRRDELSKGLLDQLNELAVMPGKCQELV